MDPPSVLEGSYKGWKGVENLISTIISHFASTSEQNNKPPYLAREKFSQTPKALRMPLDRLSRTHSKGLEVVFLQGCHFK